MNQLPTIAPETLEALKRERKRHRSCVYHVYYVRHRKHKEDLRCDLCQLADRIIRDYDNRHPEQKEGHLMTAQADDLNP